MPAKRKVSKLYKLIIMSCVTVALQVVVARPALASYYANYDQRGNYLGCTHHFPLVVFGDYSATFSPAVISEFACHLLTFFGAQIAVRPPLPFNDASGRFNSRLFFAHFDLTNESQILTEVQQGREALNNLSSDLRRAADELQQVSESARGAGSPAITARLAHLAGLPLPPQATISQCSPSVEAGSEMCVCGSFPDPPSGWSLQLGDQPLGIPTAQNSTTLFFRIPDTLSAGTYPVFSRPAAAASCQLRVLTTEASLDVHALQLTGQSFLYLRVLGTTDPTELKIENRSPGVIGLANGNFQRATTSGGENNFVRRRVRLLRGGTLTIAFEIVKTSCPCARPGLAN